MQYNARLDQKVLERFHPRFDNENNWASGLIELRRRVEQSREARDIDVYAVSGSYHSHYHKSLLKNDPKMDKIYNMLVGGYLGSLFELDDVHVTGHVTAHGPSCKYLLGPSSPLDSSS